MDCGAEVETVVEAVAVTVNVAAYDVILVNSSAGKDSQAMLDHVVGLARSAGVLDRVVVVHCDLGRVEWEGTRELAEEQAKAYGVRFDVVARPQGDLLTQIEARGMFPSSAARYCTADQKRGQVHTFITRLVKEKVSAGHVGQVKVLNCLGIRAAESPARAKKVPFEMDKRASNGKRHVDTWYPIFTWTQEQVWSTIKGSGVRHHYAYDLGMPRLSCVFCVLASKPALVLAAKHNRNLLAQYVAVEEKIGHTLKKDLSMKDIQAAVESGEDCGPVKTWEM